MYKITPEQHNALKNALSVFPYKDVQGIMIFLDKLDKMDCSNCYSKASLVSFWEYLLSDERSKLIEGETNQVHDADIANWEWKSEQ